MEGLSDFWCVVRALLSHCVTPHFPPCLSLIQVFKREGNGLLASVQVSLVSTGDVFSFFISSPSDFSPAFSQSFLHNLKQAY